jgi:hypothetical protein
MTALERITERVCRNGHPDDPHTPRPLLTLAEFFGENTCVGSICCNLSPTPEPAQVHAVLKIIEARGDVAAVRVKIAMFDDPAWWPFSDTVYVMTTASPEKVGSWFGEELRPDDVWEGFASGETYEAYDVPLGFKPVGVWWD